MAFPFLSNNRPSKTQLQRAGHRPVRALPSAPSRPMRKMLFEPLEPRVLLSAEDAVSGVLNTMQQGFDALYQELADLLVDDLFQNYVPGFLTTLVRGDDVAMVSPTLGQALEISVDVDRSGIRDSGFGVGLEGPNSLADRFAYIIEEAPGLFDWSFVGNTNAEYALDAMDINADGNVSAAEAFGVLVLGQAQYLASQNFPGGGDVEDFVADFAKMLDGTSAYFLGPYFDLPAFLADHIEIDFNAVGASPGGDIAFTLQNFTLTMKQAQQVDLGYLADELRIGLDPGAPPAAGAPTTLMVERTFSFDAFTFGFSGAMDGDATPADFYFAAPAGIDIGLDMGGTVNGMDVNVGFLGTEVTDGAGFSLDMHVGGGAFDPSNAGPLGFTGSAVSSGTGAVTAPAAPTTFDLEHDVQFSLRIGTEDYSAYRELTVGDTATNGNLTLADLIVDVQVIVDGAFGAGFILVDEDGGKLRFTLPTVDPGVAGFPPELSGENFIQATAASVWVRQQPTAFNVPDFKFLLAVDGALPKLVSVAGFAATFVDPDVDVADDEYYEVTTADLVAAIQAALNTAFGGGVVTAGDNGVLIWLTTTDATLEISRTITFDTVEKITLAELAADGSVFQFEPDPGASFAVDLELTAKAGIEIVDSDDPYTPVGTISASFNPFDQAPGGTLEDYSLQPIAVDKVPSTSEDVIKVKYDLVFGGAMDPEMLDFNVLGPSEMLGIINQVAVWLERAVGTELFTAFQLPFSQASLAEILFFGDLVRDAFLIDDGDDGVAAPDASNEDVNDTERLLKWVKVGTDYKLLPMFTNAQQFEHRLAEIVFLILKDQITFVNPDLVKDAIIAAVLPLIDASYDKDAKELTFRMSTQHNVPEEYYAPPLLQPSTLPDGISVPMDFALDLDPLGEFITESTLLLTGEGRFDFTLGVKLGDAASPLDFDSPLLTDLNSGRGVEVNTNLALTSLVDIDPIIGRLSSTATFVVSWVTTPGADPVSKTVVVSKSATSTNTTFEHLLADINAALKAAGVTDDGTPDGDLLIKAVDDWAGTDDRDTGRIVLKPTTEGAGILAFQVSASSGNVAFSELGLQPQGASTAYLVAPLPMVGPIPVGAIEFSVIIQRGGTPEPAVDVVVRTTPDEGVNESWTANNSTLTDLVNDVNAALVAAGLGTDLVAARSGNTLVLYAIDASVRGFSVTPEASAVTWLGLDAALAGDRLEAQGVDETLVAHTLAAGVMLRAQDPIANPFGRLAESLDFKINGTQVQLAAGVTATNSSILDLVRDLNEVLNGIDALKGKIVASSDGLHLVFRALDPSIAAITVTDAPGEDLGQLGFTSGDSAESALRIIANRLAPVSFGVTVPAAFAIHVTDPVNGNLDWTATLSDAVTITNRNLFDLAADLNQAMNAGFISAYWQPANGITAADNPLIAVVQGDRIVIGLKTQGGGSALVGDPSDAASTVTGFTLTADGGSSIATELGLVATGIGGQVNAANLADFIVYFSDGTLAPIALDTLVDSDNPDVDPTKKLRFKLDDAKTLQDLVDEILGQDRFDAVTGALVGTVGDKLAIELRSDGAGLVLVEKNFVEVPDEPEAFRVVAVNGSPAALQLGILASDTTQLDIGKFDAAAAGNPDGIIEGARIATLDITDRVFLAAPELHATIKLATDGVAMAEGNFGFAGIRLESAPDQLLYEANIEVPFITENGRVELGKLFSSLNTVSNLWQRVDLPVITGGATTDFTFNVSVWPDTLGDLFTLAGTPQVNFDLTSFGQLEKFASVEGGGVIDSVRLKPTLPGDPSDNLVDVTELNFGALANFEKLRLDDVLNALDTFADFLREFSDFGFLAQEIPLLGASINGLLDVANRFSAAIETVRLNPAGGLQALSQALSQGFGLPDFANDAERDAYFEARGIPDATKLIAFALESLDGTDDLMRFDLRLPVSITQSRSLDLDLGEIEFLGGVTEFVDLQGGAGLSVLGYLDTRLSFGIDLDNPGDVYLFTEATGLFGAIKAKADNLVFNAAIGPMGVFIRDGSAEINVQFGMDNGSFNPASSAKILVTDVTSLVDGDGGAEFGPKFLGEIIATLPVFFPDDSTYLGDIVLDISQANGTALVLTSPTFTPPDLGNPDILSLPDFSFIDLSQLNPFDSIPLLLDALDFFLQGLQDILDGEVFGIQLPLLGDQLSSGADFIEDMRREVLEPIRQFVEQAPETGQELVEKLLQALLGAGSAGLEIAGQSLKDFLGLDKEIIGLDLLSETVETIEDAVTGDYFWRLSLGDTYTPPVEIGFDLGFPALGLSMDAGLDIKITWELALGLGISRADGAYILLGDHRPGANADTELLVTVDVRLPDQADIEGRLGFLQLLINNRTSIDNPKGTHFFAEFGVDVFNGQDAADERLSFSELGFIDIDVSLSAQAKVDLALTAQFNDQILPETVSALLPKLRTGFLLDWDTGQINSEAFDFAQSLKYIGFDDVRLDMGSFLGDFLGPVVNKIAEITGPLQPVIDVFTARLPLISDLAGRTITLLDIAGMFGDVETGMIYAIADIITLANEIADISGDNELLISLGDFKLYEAGAAGAVGNTEFASKLALPTFSLAGAGDDDFNLDTFLGEVLPAFSTADLENALNNSSGNGESKALSQSLLNGTAPGAGNFIFPLFETPALAFQLLLGRDVSLVEYDLPPFGVDFTYVQKFPIWGPLFARITGSVGLTIDLAFGYDTYGVRKFAQGNFSNPLDLIAGFYVNDTNQPGGVGTDVPELILRGELFAGAEINLGIATAGVEGGIILTINFDLYDPDRDGKVRIDELVGNFLYEFKYGNAARAPIAIFDVFGDIALQLRAFIEFLFFEQTFEITPPITLIEFAIEFDREPILATERGDGALVLNIGANSTARLNGDTRDIGEQIFVRSVSENEVLVWSPKFNVDESAAQSYRIGTEKLVIVYGGDGNDEINLAGLGHGIAYFVDAGAGDDIVIGGSAGGEMFGGLGNDTLTGGAGRDLIVGGLGNDIIDGGDNDDWLFGDNGQVTRFELDGVPMLRFRALATIDDGDDTIYGGAGNDIVFGGGGFDLIFGGEGNDLLIGDGGYFEGPVADGGIPKVNGFVDITRIVSRGLGAADRIYGGAGGDTILGGPGNDLLDGGSGDDVVSGGTGNDIVYGGAGADWLFGDDGDDIIFGYRDPFPATNFAPDPLGDDPTNTLANESGDYIEGGDGNDFIRGQGGADRIHGNRGADIIFGDEGNDTIGAGLMARPWLAPEDQPYNTEAGGDIIFGGADDDIINAGTGADLVFGDDGLVVYLYFPDTSGLLAANQLGSRIRTDAGGDHKLIGDGDETALIKQSDLDRNDGLDPDTAVQSTSTTPDLYATEPLATDGDDYIAGGDGNDIVFGGGGDDFIYGDFDPTQALLGPRPTGQDVLIGDGGRVELYGRRYQAIEAVANLDYDGIDTISGNDGGDYIFGGGNEDIIFGFENPAEGDNTPLGSVSENDVIFGDNGRIEFDPSDRFNRITRMFTTNAGVGESGASDTIDGQWGDDVIFGGFNSSNDVLSGGLGNDIVIGDQGEVLFYAPGLGAAWEVFPDDDFPTFDPDFAGREFWNESFPLFLVRSYADNLGGSDIISGNEGDDILIGGTAGDFMYGDDPTGSSGAADGEDIMLGDNGEVWFNIDFAVPEFVGDDPVPPPNTSIGRLTAQAAAMPYASAIDRIRTSDTSETTGGADFMSGSAGADILFGGVNAGGVDRLFGDREAPDAASLALDGDDILIGDNGVVDFAFGGDSDRMTLDLIRSYEDALGGTDIISGDAGHDVAIGGTGGDVIFGDRAEPNADSLAADGNDTLIGDNADIFLVAAPDPLPLLGRDLKLVLDAAVFLLRSTDEDYDPTVPANNTGGVDTIAGNAGDDVILGGVEGDYLYGDGVSVAFDGAWNVISRTAVRSLADGADIILGDNGALEWLSTGRFGDVQGVDLEGENPGLWAHFDGGADDDLTTLDLITTEQPNDGGRDWIWGGDGNDTLFGGTDADTLFGDNGFTAQGMGGIGDGLPESSGDGDGGDLMFGDHGRLYPQFSALWDGEGDWRAALHSRNFFAIDTGELDGGEGDRMWGQGGDDNMLGQQGDDRMWGGDDHDDMIGGHNVRGGWDELGLAGEIAASIQGVHFNDVMDGGAGDDVMAGDNAIIWRRGDTFDPRFRSLTEAAIYTTTSDSITTNIDGTGQLNPSGADGRDVTLLDHDFTIQADPQGRFGRDIMAGGADDDRMFGQLDDDLMQGDGEIDLEQVAGPYLSWQVDAPGLEAVPADDPYLVLYFNIPERLSDGDDYMEGNGGADLMFGGLGQDDMIGGSSELYGLETHNQRPDGSDIMFGGAGLRIDRSDFGGTINGIAFATQDETTKAITVLPEGHARDADYMMGDNANIYRLVGGGQLLTFNYDNYGPLKIIPRAMEQLDYHLGGADYRGGTYVDGAAVVAGQPRDNGAPDFMHGEAGDDIMFGMTGSDLMFGGAGDDDMIGGYGHDWMSGGTGQDGMLGDDGLIFTSRNSAAYGEPLHGIDALLGKDPRPKYSDGNVLNEIIYTPGNIQYSMINIEGQLKKSVDITPFSFDPDWEGMDDEYPDNADDTPFADDILFGGLGSDWIHGGSGDDAISGAEALTAAFITVFDGDGQPVDILDLGYHAVGLPNGPWMFLGISTYGTQNPGNALAFNPVDVDGWKTQNRARAGEFFYYDEYDPLRRIMLTDDGELHKGEPAQGTANEFLLNFDPTEGVLREGGWTPGNKNQSFWYDPVNDDGADNLFGGNGNDWLVGGTGRDHLYGGWGNDLLNVDDDHSTNGALNDQPDTHPTYEDIAYGGAGRDVLIANTGGDRLIDWVGEYNSYLVPFAPFGMATVSRTLQPFLPEYLYALSMGDGIDLTRADDAAADGLFFDPVRNGEPFGELGLVLQKDFAWQAQTGAPADPQAGNIPGGKRDVLRTAYADGLNMTGFMIDSGNWTVAKGKFQVEPLKIGGDALAVWHHDQYTPNYFEVTATVNVVKPIAGFKANAYIIFDYQDADNFKFAGLNGSTNKVEIGQKTANGWVVLTSINLQVRHSTDYNMLLSVNGTSVILQVNNQHQVSFTFAPRVDADGMIYNINSGMIGLGADNAKAGIGNVRLQVLPPQITHSATDDFSNTPSLVSPLLGGWSLDDGRMVAQPAGGAQLALAAGGLKVGPAYVLQLETTVSTGAMGGIIFDQYSTDDFKWAAWSKATNQVQLGHYTERDGWVVDKTVTMKLAGDVELSVTLKGTTVSVLVNDSPAVSHLYNAVVTDGHFGLFSLGGSASFDHFTVMTDDPSFAAPESSDLTAAFAGSGAGVTALDTASLDTMAQAAMNRWTLILGGVPVQFYGLQFEVADLGGLALARIEGNTVTVDESAAGHGWFIDPTPYDDGEFKVRTADGLRATPSSEAHGKIDLLTVLMHELGHAIGYHHDASVPGATALMTEDLVPGLRAVDFVPPGQASQAPAMWTWDADKGAFVQDAAGWQNGRLFSYLSLAAVKQAATDDWLAVDATGETEAGEDWLEFAPAASEEGGEASLIEWVGL